MRKFVDKQPGEVLTFCDGYQPLRDANKVLKAHGLALRWRGHPDMGDQVFVRVEKLPEKGAKGEQGEKKGP